MDSRIYQCWDCGQRVEQEAVHRLGRSPAVYRRKQRVNLCDTCYEKHRRRDTRIGLLSLAVLAAIVIVLVLFFTGHL